MDRFYIVTNNEKDPDHRFTNIIKNYLENHGKICGTHSPETDYDDPIVVPEETQCIIVLGGDGTFLHAARQTHRLQIPMIGINLGTLGYLTDINKNAIFPAMDQLMNDAYTIEHRIMLYGKVIRNNKVLIRDTALNDIVISRAGHQKLISLENYVNGNILNRYRADGVIIATPTGSTGYSLSAGGPIISPDSDLFLVTPLAPQSLIDRSIVLPTNRAITVKLSDEAGGNVRKATVNFDGDTNFEIESGDEVIIKKSNKDTLIVKLSDTTFLEVLYQKMNPIALTEVLQ